MGISILFVTGCTIPLQPIPTQTPVSQVQVVPTTPPVTDTPNTPLTCLDEELLCVGLVTDIAGVDDRSFNQSAWEGVLRAQRDLGARVEFIESMDAADYTTNINHFAEQDFDVIVTVGFNLQSSTIIAAEEYSHIHFIGVDQFQGDADIKSNVSGLIFSEKKAGFLAGALAAMLTETGTVGAVLGTEQVPPIVAFKEGFELGALAIQPEIQVLTTYHPGGVATAFTDPDWGQETAKGMIEEGADVIFAAAGGTGNGALVEVASYDDHFCIGVDSDQWLTVPEAHQCLVSSAMKQIDEGVFELIAWSLVGAPKSGNYVGNVQLAPFHDFDEDLSTEAKIFLTDLKRGLEEGSIPLDGTFVHASPPRAFLDP